MIILALQEYYFLDIIVFLLRINKVQLGFIFERLAYGELMYVLLVWGWIQNN